MPFAFLSGAVVVFAVPAVFWHLLIVRGVGRATPGQLAATAGAMLAACALACWLVRAGPSGDGVGGLPWLPLVTVGAGAAAAWALRGRVLGRGVPQQVLLAAQLFRPIGLVFLVEAARGTLPAAFARPAGWGDLAAGLAAAGVLLRHPTGAVPRGAVRLVAAVGLADFASALFFGLTSSATPVQLFAFGRPNRVLDWPLGFIPVLLVPYAVAAHLELPR